jgi:hypothetical protein
MPNDKQSNESPEPKGKSEFFSLLAEKLERSGVPHRKIGEPLVGPLAEVAAGGYVMHSAVSPSSKPSSTPKSDESPEKPKDKYSRARQPMPDGD